MTGLTLLLVLVAIVLLLLLLSIAARINRQQEMLENLDRKIEKLIHQSKENPASFTENISQQVPATTPVPAKEIITFTALPPEEPVAEEPVTPVIPSSTALPEEEEYVIAPQIVSEAIKPRVGKPTGERDLEKYIGENIANKIGIAVLVLGIAFFIKYAIDKDWVNELGRVLIAVASGVLLIGIAHRIRKKYRSFSSVLVGGGLSVLYFSVAFAFHEYHLIGQQVAFALMLVITGLAVALSLKYDRAELAILATLGGFATPFLVSTGNNNYHALFIYLAILCAGMTILSWFKRWPAVNIIAMLGTLLIYGGWLVSGSINDGYTPFPYRHAFLYGTLYYFLFLGMHLLNNLRLRRRFTVLDFLLVLGTNFLYFVAGLHILENWQHDQWSGVFTGLLGVLNLSLALTFYRKPAVDRNFVLLLIGLAVSFISLIAPVQLKGEQITLFWAAESVILLWIYLRSGIGQLRIAHLILALAALTSLLLVWMDAYVFTSGVTAVVINKAVLTGLPVSIAFAISHWLHRKEAGLPGPVYKASFFSSVFLALSLAVGFMTGILEILYQFSMRFTATSLEAVYCLFFTLAYMLFVLWIYRKQLFVSQLWLLFAAAGSLLYLLVTGLQADVTIYLLEKGPLYLYLGHWAGTALLLYMPVYIIQHIRRRQSGFAAYQTPYFTWIATIVILIILSTELYQVMLWLGYRDQADWLWWQNLYYKAGLSILWSVCSFILIWLGLKYRYRPLRIISLCVFAVTLAKLFLYDIRNIPPGGKIAAFILLGILLLTVSFMYQRLKAMLIDQPDMMNESNDKMGNKQ